MSIKAIFPAGVTDITVNGLHQWDYGQKLEIQADDLPGVIEVHFAHAGARDAVVRVCEVVEGVAETTIPDACLEQTSPVLAWVYVVDDTAGATVKTIVLPIIARAQPQASATEPAAFSDKYTELITAVNAQVEALKRGEVTAAKAVQAEEAIKARAVLKHSVTLKKPSGSVSVLAPGLYVIEYADAGTGDNRRSALFYVPSLETSVYGEYVSDTERLYFNAEYNILGIGATNTTSSGSLHIYDIKFISLQVS